MSVSGGSVLGAEVQTLELKGTLDSGNNVQKEFDAAEDRNIVGFRFLDEELVSGDLEFFWRMWFGGADPDPGSPSNDLNHRENDDFVLEIGQGVGQIGTSGAGAALGLTSGVNWLPAHLTIPWNEDETMNLKAFHGNSSTVAASLDATIYYAERDELMSALRAIYG